MADVRHQECWISLPYLTYAEININNLIFIFNVIFLANVFYLCFSSCNCILRFSGDQLESVALITVPFYTEFQCLCLNLVSNTGSCQLSPKL